MSEDRNEMMIEETMKSLAEYYYQETDEPQRFAAIYGNVKMKSGFVKGIWLRDEYKPINE